VKVVKLAPTTDRGHRLGSGARLGSGKTSTVFGRAESSQTIRAICPIIVARNAQSEKLRRADLDRMSMARGGKSARRIWGIAVDRDGAEVRNPQRPAGPDQEPLAMSPEPEAPEGDVTDTPVGWSSSACYRRLVTLGFWTERVTGGRALTNTSNGIGADRQSSGQVPGPAGISSSSFAVEEVTRRSETAAGPEEVWTPQTAFSFLRGMVS
jgi:hypothetical protein